MGLFTWFLYQAQRSLWQEWLSSRLKQWKTRSVSYFILEFSMIEHCWSEYTKKTPQTKSYQCPVKYCQYFRRCLSWHPWGLDKSFSQLIVAHSYCVTSQHTEAFPPLDISNQRGLRLKQMLILLDPRCIIMHFVLMNFFPFLLLQLSRTSNWKYKKELF